MIADRMKRQKMVSGVAAFAMLSLVFCGAGTVKAEEVSGSNAGQELNGQFMVSGTCK